MGRKRLHASAADKQHVYREKGGRGVAVGNAKVKSYGVTEKNGAGSVLTGMHQHAAVSGLLVLVLESLPGERVRAVVVAPGGSGLLVGVAYPFKRAALSEVQA